MVKFGYALEVEDVRAREFFPGFHGVPADNARMLTLLEFILRRVGKSLIHIRCQLSVSATREKKKKRRNNSDSIACLRSKDSKKKKKNQRIPEVATRHLLAHVKLLERAHVPDLHRCG